MDAESLIRGVCLEMLGTSEAGSYLRAVFYLTIWLRTLDTERSNIYQSVYSLSFQQFFFDKTQTEGKHILL